MFGIREKTPALGGGGKGSRGAPYAGSDGRRRPPDRARRASAGTKRAPAQKGQTGLGARPARRLAQGLDRLRRAGALPARPAAGWRRPSGYAGDSAGAAPETRTVDADLRARDRALAPARSRPRDRGRLLLRRGRADQRLHGRLSGTEPHSRPRRRRGPLVGVRPRLQRPAGAWGAQARLARRLEPLLADAARPDGVDGALRSRRAVGDRSVRQPRPRLRACSRAVTGALPDRDAARGLRNHRRDPQQLRPLHRARDLAGLLEPRDHRRARDRGPEGERGERGALRLRRVDSRRDRDPGPPAGAVAAGPRAWRRAPPHRARLARPCCPPAS